MDESRVKVNEDGSKTVQLSEPIKSMGNVVVELTVKKPKVKHLKAIDPKKSQAEQSIALMAVLTNSTPLDLEELSLDDFALLTSCLGGALPLAQ
jgi:hypothetical protein